LEAANGSARLDVLGTPIVGVARTQAPRGAPASGIIRIERVRCSRATAGGCGAMHAPASPPGATAWR
jgi:hypothetical protein